MKVLSGALILISTVRLGLAADVITNSYLNLGHNDIEVIEKEIGDSEFSELLWSTLKLKPLQKGNPRVHLSASGPDLWLDINVDSGLSENQKQLLKKTIATYAALRGEGHTFNYSRQAVVRMKGDKASVQNSDFLLIRESFPDVPLEKLAALKADMILDLYPKKETDSLYYMLDGSIAWVYIVTSTVNGDKVVVLKKIDAQEADSDFAKVYMEVRSEVAEEFKKSNSETSGSAIRYWNAVKRGLSKRGFEWKSPYELSPPSDID